MELIEIVDKDGNATGELIDKEQAHNKNLLHNEVGCLIINGKGQVLLQKRSANKKFDPNKWALCAGHVDAGESLDDAMKREIKEEIGINIVNGELKSYGAKEVKIKQKNSHITYFYYLVKDLPVEAFKVQQEELSEVKWFDIDEVIKMLINNDERLALGSERVYLFSGLNKEKL